MIALEWTDLGEHFDAELLEAAYRQVYLPAFPIRDEQEDPAVWAPRLIDPAARPRLSFLIAGMHLDDPDRRVIHGLLIAEYYADSRCLLVSYVAVAESARRQGVARYLFDVLKSRIEAGTVAGGAPVAGVLAEVHDPARIAAAEDVIDPWARIEAMTGLGARKLPIDYVQPALGVGKQPSHTLWLMIIPVLTGPDAVFTTTTLREFLIEFYRLLGSAEPERDSAYATVFASIDRLAAVEAGGEPIHEAPELRVRSSLHVRKAAVAFQYLIEAPVNPDVTACAPDTPYCRHFHSYEKDLLSHAFRRPPPFRTYCVASPHATALANPYGVRCTLVFPEIFRYQSEGETFTLRRQGPASVEASVSFSRTDFIRSSRSVLNLVVHLDLDENEAVGEYELLSLTKLWCPSDDSETRLLGAANVRYADRVYTLESFARAHFFVASGAPLPAPVGGCLQIVYNALRGEEADTLVAARTDAGAISVRELFDAIAARQQEGAAAPDAKLVEPLKAVACLLQNILDIHNVDMNELDDMLEGIDASASAITGIHRGMLLSLTENDRVFDDKADTIGVTPYLLLPQALLLHNQSILFDAHALLRQAEHTHDLLGPIPVGMDKKTTTHRLDAAHALRARLVGTILRKQSLSDLPGSPDWLIRTVAGRLWKRYLSARDDARRPPRHVAAFVAEIDEALRDGATAHARQQLGQWLDRDYLGNVFQYVSERWIVDTGNQDRGLDILLNELRKNLDNLDARIDDSNTRHGEWKDSNLAAIGLVITLFQIVPFEGAFRLLGMKSGDETSGPGLLAWGASGLALMLILLWRRMLALVYMRALGHASRADAAHWMKTTTIESDA